MKSAIYMGYKNPGQKYFVCVVARHSKEQAHNSKNKDGKCHHVMPTNLLLESNQKHQTDHLQRERDHWLLQVQRSPATVTGPWGRVVAANGVSISNNKAHDISSCWAEKIIIGTHIQGKWTWW